MSLGANYNGRQQNNTAYIKEFNTGTQLPLWTTTLHLNPNTNTQTQVIIPASNKINSLYIPGNLYVDGLFVHPSDEKLKDNIVDLMSDKTDKLMNVRATQFTLKNDVKKEIHYGFIAQEFEKQFPELVVSKPDKTMKDLKAINYLEIIPLLVNKIQMMQNEINDLKIQNSNNSCNCQCQCQCQYAKIKTE